MDEPLTGRLYDLQRLLAAVVECAVDGLTDAPERAFVAPGQEVAWDCDQVWVRVLTVEPRYPTSSNVRGATQAPNCGPNAWDVSIGVGAIRCVAVMDDQGSPPSSEVVTENGHEMTRDMLELLVAIQCCALPVPLRIGSWAPQGPMGGYAGGEWTVSLTLLN